jgi:RNA polymerase-interacting CarD/CdnL/TRCF family regulator
LVFDRVGLALILRKVDLAETVRVPIDRKKAKQLLEHIRNWDGKARKEWKARALVHQSVMDEGDPFGYVDVYRGLSQLESEGALRATDREHLKHSLELLVEELAYVLGRTPDQAREQIIKAAAA